MALNKKELVQQAEKLTLTMRDETWVNQFRAKTDDKGMLFANQLFDVLEEMQIELLTCDGRDGRKVLQALKMAIKNFPNDQDIRLAVMALVQVEEKLLDTIQREIAKKNNVELPEAGGGDHGHGGHGHSHGGQPCNHSHGGGHGHSHGNPQQMAAMQAAMASLSPEQKATMQSIQMKMMTGQPPSPEEQQKAIVIRQHLQAYMQTMQAAMAGAAAQKQAGGGAPAAQPKKEE